MKPERWQKVKRICEDALECEAGQREAFLGRACVGDDQLRKEVDSFLAGGAGKDRFIETAAFEMAAKEMAKDEAAADLSGESFLHYHLIEKIGAGGMGEVYRARDDRLKRDIAIKVLPGIFTDNAERLARFDREATLLASLNHPNVATIHAVEHAGTKRFIVLELVQGKTLTQRLTRGPLPLAVKISSFLIDRYEITNRQFKEFIDGGGYQKRDYWKQDFVQSGRQLAWEEAMELFRDSTGRPGSFHRGTSVLSRN
jgi:hypothetical protein